MSIGYTNCENTWQHISGLLWACNVRTSNMMALPVHAGSQRSMYRSLVCLLFTFNWASSIAIVKDYRVNVNESRPNGQIASNLVLSNRQFRKLKPFWFFFVLYVTLVPTYTASGPLWRSWRKILESIRR